MADPKIDTHHHLIEEDGYVDRLLRVMDRHAIERTALLGLGEPFRGLFVKGTQAGWSADNDAVERTFRAHPDRFFGLAFMRLGDDHAALVDGFAERGFRGLKFHIPRLPYDDERLFPVYARAQELGLPCLFHTGIVKLPVPRPGDGIRSTHMSVMRLEAVAQEFPRLPIIAAHLGVQDHLAALTLVRLFPNLYADLSGSTPGWRANLSPDDWRRLLWFPDAPRKLLFGTDVHADEIPANLQLYETICDAAGWDAPARRRLYHDNATELFHL